METIRLETLTSSRTVYRTDLTLHGRVKDILQSCILPYELYISTCAYAKKKQCVTVKHMLKMKIN